MSANNELEKKLQDGIAASRRGDRATARRLLEEVVHADENNELAWMWLASAVTNMNERRACLERALEINPNNQRAKDAMERLGVKAGATPRGTQSESDETVDRLREMQRAQPQRRVAPADDSEPILNRINISALLTGALVVIAVIIVLLIASTLLQSAGESTQSDVLQPPTTLPTAVPPRPTYTPYVVDMSEQTRTAPTLPPTFTPTFTPTATETLTPTQTPYPLTEFSALYTSRNSDEAEPGLYRINGDGSGEQGLLENVSQLAYGPSGNLLALVRSVTYPPDENWPDESTVTEIFIAPANNPAAAEQLTELRTASAYSPTWSPDERQLVFVSDWDGDEELFVIDVENGVTRQLTQNEGIDRDPAWSPDGETIVFASDRYSPGATEIFSLVFARIDESGRPPDSDAFTQFTDAGGSSYAPAWSPDGSLIVFISDRSDDGDVYTMDSNGHAPRLLTVGDDGAEDRNPTFTPDGEWVAFVSNREGDVFQLYLVSLRGDALMRLTDNEREDVAVHYRPELILRLRGEG